MKAYTVTVKAQPLHSTKNTRLHETIIVVVIITYNHYIFVNSLIHYFHQSASLRC